METSLASSQSVFVLELVSSGYFGDEIGESFRREGRAMLDAVLADFRRIPNVAVETILDKSAVGNRGLLLERVRNHRADAALIIAPEFDHLLEDFCAAVKTPNVASLNCGTEALALCGDKWRFAQHLATHRIATIPTVPYSGPLSPSAGERARVRGLPFAGMEFPCVVKPRDGAGSWLVRLIHNSEERQSVADEFYAAGRGEFLYQPFISGRSYSVGALIRHEHEPELLPIAEQHLSDDGEFRYLGGSIPANLSADAQTRIHRLVARCLHSIPGLNGYVGCDVIVPSDRPEELLIVELNPRLTTSYIGYRQLCADNLMERLFFPDRVHHPLRWRDGSVTFDAHGNYRYADHL